jgi:hypothetical protein
MTFGTHFRTDNGHPDWVIIIIIIIIIIILTANGILPLAAVLQSDTSHKITHRTQTEHGTQNYKNNKGHTHIHTIKIQRFKH